MSEQNKARIAEFLERVLSSGEISAAGEYFHDDMVEEVPFPGQWPGLVGLKETLAALRTAFPDMRWSVQEQIAEDCRVVTRFVWEETQRGDLLGIPPTNRAVSVSGMVIDQFEGSKVKSTRILMDTMGLMQQLGALPGAPECVPSSGESSKLKQAEDPCSQPRHRVSAAQCGLTLPSSGRPQAGFAHFRSPLMSTVRRHKPTMSQSQRVENEIRENRGRTPIIFTKASISQ